MSLMWKMLAWGLTALGGFLVCLGRGALAEAAPEASARSAAGATGPGSGLLRWEAPTAIVVAPPGRGAWYPRLLILPDGRWLAGYDTNVGTDHTYIQVAESRDGGRTWQPLAVASFGEGNAANASLAISPDGRLYLAYRLVRPGQYELRLSVSDDGGRTWRPQSVIARGVRGLWEPAIGWVGDELWAFYSTEEHAPWLPQAIGFRRSTDGGQTWEREALVTRNSRSRDGMPAWVLQGQTVYLAFEATDLGNPFVIKLITSPDGGRTWSSPRLVYQPVDRRKRASAPAVALLPTAVVSEQGPAVPPCLVVAFQTDEDDPQSSGDAYTDIKYVWSFDGGSSWSAAYSAWASPWPDHWSGLITLADGRLALSVTSGNQLLVRLGRLAAEPEAGQPDGG